MVRGKNIQGKLYILVFEYVRYKSNGKIIPPINDFGMYLFTKKILPPCII